ncbi:MAG: ABC transporter substrate-binding protein [Planctomycetes bacterium]|nr:ABC transporter substrate-binding protein [Planctomycetota bacterium]
MMLRWILAVACCGVLLAEDPSDGFDRVRVQLNWYHQFQFAGLYAAEYRGYFRDEALEIELVETAPGLEVGAELDYGRAQFGVLDAKIVNHWARGRDIALLAVILQRNPSVLLVHEDSPYLTLSDLLADPEARLVGPAGAMDPELRIALTAMGRDPDAVFPRLKRLGDLETFAARQLDVLPGYLTSEPFKLKRLGVSTRQLRLNADIRSPFFGDALVCRGDLLRSRPDLVARFRRAVLRGWEWALENRSEMIRIIPTRWPSGRQQMDPDTLAEEAEALETLIDRQVIPLGTISTSRLETIAGLLRSAGQPGMVRRDLIWQEPDPLRPWMRILVWSLSIAAIACAILLAVIWATRRRLHSSTLSQQRMMDLAEAFFLFHASVDARQRMRMIQASPSMSSILGGPRSAYLADADVLLHQVVAEDREPLLLAINQAVVARQPLRHRFRISHPDHAKPRHLLMHAVPIPGSEPMEFDGLVLDLTAEAEASEALLEVQRRLQTAQRNESLGLLAGGVAHDFNNLLGAIRANAELALNRLPDEHEAKPRVARVLQAADRAASLVRQILAYAGKGTIELRAIDLGEECRVLRDLLKHAVPDNVRIDLHIAEDLPKVMFDPAQLQQVLVNLIVNAAESYGGKEGVVSIHLNRARDQRDAVRIEIEDQGCGMDAATQARMFEPYFTTKRTGHGLGLAAVQGIVNASGAKLSCRTAPGVGTTFTVIFPTAAGKKDASHIDTPKPIDGRHLLIVDDDEDMREAAAQMARELGYTVDTAEGGVSAARLLGDGERRYVAAIIDCTMPDRDGTEVVRELRRSGDRRPFLLVSGMVEASRIGTGILDNRTRFLAKPFSRAMLDRSLRILLRRSADKDSASSSTFAVMQRESSLHVALRPEQGEPPAP